MTAEILDLFNEKLAENGILSFSCRLKQREKEPVE
jgi:hypothetical protein